MTYLEYTNHAIFHLNRELNAQQLIFKMSEGLNSIKMEVLGFRKF